MLRRSTKEGDLKVLVDGELNMSQQCPGSQQGHHVLGCIRSSIARTRRIHGIPQKSKKAYQLHSKDKRKPFEASDAFVLMILAKLLHQFFKLSLCFWAHAFDTQQEYSSYCKLLILLILFTYVIAIRTCKIMEKIIEGSTEKQMKDNAVIVTASTAS
ncbi:hypothetical protein HGM15179_009646 [Zosterops borbonicus]|uniref:Uncharacterized protein n=1 Tax=Zosterops borbonicus TaxID=364589 RepID=A0A8K1LKZ8_9PASS|nr:hypothetical protein HGM15179_009646 [Zosterops borbonicus]